MSVPTVYLTKDEMTTIIKIRLTNVNYLTRSQIEKIPTFKWSDDLKSGSFSWSYTEDLLFICYFYKLTLELEHLGLMLFGRNCIMIDLREEHDIVKMNDKLFFQGVPMHLLVEVFTKVHPFLLESKFANMHD
jgi:hypothetical protein